MELLHAFSMRQGIVKSAGELGPFDERPAVLSQGVVRWATARMTNGFTSIMFPVPPPTGGSKRNRKKGGFLTGVVAYMNRLYVITFHPLFNLIEWRLLNENEIHLYRVSQEIWEAFQDPAKPVPNGSIQDQMISRIVEHLIHISPHWENPEIQEFYKNHTWEKRAKLKKIVVPNLHRQSMNEISEFVVCLAILDPTTQWKNSGNHAKCATVVLHGKPWSPLFIHGFSSFENDKRHADYSFTVKYSNDELTVNEISFGCWARKDFWELMRLVERHNEKIKIARAKK